MENLFFEKLLENLSSPDFGIVSYTSRYQIANTPGGSHLKKLPPKTITKVTNLSPYLTIKEAAAYLGLKPSYVYKLTHNRKIPFYKPSNGRLYFLTEELDKWVADGRQWSEEEIDERAADYTLRNRKLVPGRKKRK